MEDFEKKISESTLKIKHLEKLNLAIKLASLVAPWKEIKENSLSSDDASWKIYDFYLKESVLKKEEFFTEIYTQLTNQNSLKILLLKFNIFSNSIRCISETLPRNKSMRFLANEIKKEKLSDDFIKNAHTFAKIIKEYSDPEDIFQKCFEKQLDVSVYFGSPDSSEAAKFKNIVAKFHAHFSDGKRFDLGF